MNSCRRNIDQAHTEHFCKDHERTPKSKSYRQQSYAEWNQPKQDEDPESKLRLLQEQLTQRVTELRNQKPTTTTTAKIDNVRKQETPVKEDPVTLGSSEDEHLPPLASSSESGGEQPYGGQYNSSSEEESESEVDEAAVQREAEESSGKIRL